MKIQLIGANKITGTSTKSGTPKPYNINEIIYLVDNESFEKKDGTFKKEGLGKNIQTLNINDELFNGLKDVQFPKNAELEFDTDIFNGKPVTRIKSVKVQ